jgi:hypothetical protein
MNYQDRVDKLFIVPRILMLFPKIFLHDKLEALWKEAGSGVFSSVKLLCCVGLFVNDRSIAKDRCVGSHMMNEVVEAGVEF